MNSKFYYSIQKKFCNNINNTSNLVNKYKVNTNKLNIAQKSYNLKKSHVSNRDFSKKVFYFAISSFSVLLGIYYLSGSKTMFKKIELNTKIKNYRNESYKKRNIDIDQMDKQIVDFDNKWEINKTIQAKENRVNIGNKLLNQRENIVENKVANIKENNIIDDDDKIINLESTKDDKKTVEEFVDKNIKVKHISGENYEQTKFYETKENNIDPRIMGNTIIFDSRLNEKKIVIKK